MLRIDPNHTSKLTAKYIRQTLDDRTPFIIVYGFGLVDIYTIDEVARLISMPSESEESPLTDLFMEALRGEEEMVDE